MADTTQTEPRILIHDWAPLGQALVVRAADAAWPLHGAALLASRQVPNFTHDSGSLSRHTASVLLAWCEEQEALELLPERIVVLEAGMGTGAHLRLMLRAFAAEAKARDKDWSQRLLVWATDVAPTTVQQAFRRGMFADLGLDVRPAVLDARQPGLLLSLAEGAQRQTAGEVHLLISHYLLGTQPMDVFVRRHLDDGDRWQVATARVWLTQAERLAALTDLPLAGAVAALQQGDAALAVTLGGLLAVESSWQTIDLASHPDAEALAATADALEAALGSGHDLLRDGTVVNHGAAALQMAWRLATLLAPQGIAVIRDVGVVDPTASAVPRGYVQYGSTLAPGVPFWEWDQWFAGGFSPDGLRSHAPSHDGVRDHGARLLTRAELPATVTAFAAAFDGELAAAPLRALDATRNAATPGEALEALRSALAGQPDDWVLLLRAAELALGLGQSELADVLCETGLQLNAAGSHELWRLRAELLAQRGDAVGALAALREALDIVPRDARLLLRTAQVNAALGRWPAVFTAAGLALAEDPAGQLRAPIVQLLQAALAATAPAA